MGGWEDGQNERDKDEREEGELRAQRHTETETVKAVQTNKKTTTLLQNCPYFNQSEIIE